MELLDPVINHFKRLGFGYVVYQEHTIYVPVVIIGDGSVSLGTGGVPNLHLQGDSLFGFQAFLFVLDPDGWKMRPREFFVHILGKQGGFSNVALA